MSGVSIMPIIEKFCKEYRIDLQGDISRLNVAEIESQLRLVIQDGEWNRILLNMNNVNFIDSAGLGVLATAHSLVRDRNRELVLSGVNPPVQMVFEITGLDKVFNFLDLEN
jgi:anti-sigma B factor antagonist